MATADRGGMIEARLLDLGKRLEMDPELRRRVRADPAGALAAEGIPPAWVQRIVGGQDAGDEVRGHALTDPDEAALSRFISDWWLKIEP